MSKAQCIVCDSNCKTGNRSHTYYDTESIEECTRACKRCIKKLNRNVNGHHMQIFCKLTICSKCANQSNICTLQNIHRCSEQLTRDDDEGKDNGVRYCVDCQTQFPFYWSIGCNYMYDDGPYSENGNIDTNQCKACYQKNEFDDLKAVIYSAKTSLSEYSLSIIVEYAKGHIFKCHNYGNFNDNGRCYNKIYIGSAIDIQSSYYTKDYDGNDVYHYFVDGKGEKLSYQRYLHKIGDRYMRIFCRECTTSEALDYRCTHGSCWNQDIRMPYINECAYGSCSMKCLNHANGYDYWFAMPETEAEYLSDINAGQIGDEFEIQSQKDYNAKKRAKKNQMKQTPIEWKAKRKYDKKGRAKCNKRSTRKRNCLRMIKKECVNVSR